MIDFKQRFDIDDISALAGRYGDAEVDAEVLALGELARERGSLTRDDLLIFGRWKSPRIVGLLESNESDIVPEIVRFALSARTEHCRITPLLTLRGVGWPMASVLLHFCHRDPYPILDFRALWSLGVEEPSDYTLEFWLPYTHECRRIAELADVSMRTLDQALWRYSFEHQTPRTSSKVEKDESRTVAGVDSCPRGWFCIWRSPDAEGFRHRVFGDIEAIVEAFPDDSIIAIDIPIGLSDDGPRAPDSLARECLAPKRSSSVFPAPIRPALKAQTRSEADDISRRSIGKGVAAQSFGIYAKVRQVDEFLQADPSCRERILEVHPEVSFWAWNGGSPMEHSKKTAEGERARMSLVESRYGEGVVDRIRLEYTKSAVATDDILDAFAALWTAERLADSKAASLPAEPTTDSTGLVTAIWY